MTSRRTKRLVLGFGFLFFFLAIVVFSIARYFAHVAEQRRYAEEKASLKPREPLTVEVARRNADRERRYTAEVQPWYQAAVAAEVAGRVVEARVNAGTSVQKGDPLVLLDETMARLDLNAAAAQLASSRAQLAEAQRLEKEAAKLFGRKVISDSEYTAAQSRATIASAEVARMEAELGRLREMLDRHRVQAPFDGTVRERLVDVGDAVNVNQTVAAVVQTDPLRVVFHVTDREVAALREGMQIVLRLPGEGALPLTPEVVHVSHSADPATRLFRIEARLENPRHELLSGTEGVVSVTLEALEDQLMIPTDAVRLVGQKAMVERRKPDGTTETLEIRVGAEIDGAYPVESGLTEGERLLIR